MTVGRLLIRPDDLSGGEIVRFLDDHITEMRSVTPPGSKHALDLAGLRRPEVDFWSVYDSDDGLVGCGAMLALDEDSVEIKSMRTAPAYRGHGVASMLLKHILAVATHRGFSRASLETGSSQFFVPARRLYRAHGFDYCEPFADYVEDPNSVFMTRGLRW